MPTRTRRAEPGPFSDAQRITKRAAFPLSTHSLRAYQPFPFTSDLGFMMENQQADTIAAAEAFRQAVAMHERGQLDHAEQIYRAILDVNSNDTGSLYNLAILCFQRARYSDALLLLREVVSKLPDLAMAHNSLAIVLRHLTRLEEAEASCREALRIAPEYAEVYNTLGDTLAALGRFAEAEACCREALRLQPEYAEAHTNLGMVLTALGRPDEAEICCREALRLNPGNGRAQLNLSATLAALGRPEEAEICCREALRLNPGAAEAHLSLGTVLIALNRLEEAESCYRQAVHLSGANFAAHMSLGNALLLQRKRTEAAAHFGQAVSLKPDDQEALSAWFHERQHLCDWSDYGGIEVRVRSAVGGEPSPGTAFGFLALSSTPEEQLRLARRVATKLAPREIALLPRRQPRMGDRIRLGYLSRDFYYHATAFLLTGLIEQHDRRGFEVVGYSYGPDDGSTIRARVAAAFDRFVDIGRTPHRQAAELINRDAVDILIDLAGFASWCRTPILAYRPAPIQVNYLGYPGTMGADFIDYIIVDPFVVPTDQQPFFSERLVHLPDTYQCNDDKREIADRTPSRAECGLPEAGFVFCCFNNTYKITPAMFDIWMRLLRAVPGSVLWLLDANSGAKANLAREAAARGVGPEHIIFAPRLPLPEHLARHRLADLFLDTLPYNAHTTASDALWAGLPVLTCSGETFAGRVAGSLLRTIGLRELITTSLDEYEALALRLARDAPLLAQLRDNLAENRLTSPLFDTECFTRNLEAAYRQMWEMWRTGRSPTAFSVSPAARG